MRLKQFMFALTAMLLSFVSVNAQEGIVAKIGNSEYTTFANAMTDANAATGNVTVEVYGAVEFIDGMELNGSYTAITFTGMSTGAKITINQTAGGDYLTAHGKTVAFNDLILAKANPAWSGNSGHMGNYFSIQGGTVTYTGCTFPNGACTSTGTAVYNNCTFQNASEYGLWVYDDALVTVNGGTIDSTKGIKVYSEGEQDVTSTLTVQNATFTENVTAKPAVAVGYAQSITLIGNTYNNTTGHVELDSGSDADCDGIAFVAEDSEGNDISSELTVVDRSNSSAPCGVLVDGKIYTTVTTAAAEATSGSTVTLLYSTTETVELPEGVTLDKNDFTADNVTVEVSLAGEGTEASPYLISSVADLETLRNKVNAGNSYEGQFVKLAADLTLTEAWTPIGNGTRSSKSYSGNAFKGTFDGGNKTISGLKITSTTGSDAAIGLFGVVDGGTVKNLTLDNVDINVTNSNLAGGAIGLMLGGATAENITVNGAIVGYDGVGGIVGRLVISGTIENCTNNASVTSSYGGIGGIVGKAYYEDSANTSIFASIDNCTNNGTVTAPMYVGGIVGLARANVTDCVNNGPVVGGTQTGGIIGQLIAAGTVSGNENKAKISGKNHLGGIIGDYSQSSAYSYYNVAITSNINRGELAATEQCAAIMGCNNIDGFTAMTAAGNVSYYFVDGLELFGNPEDMVIDANNKFVVPVAKIGDVEYATLAEAVAAAQAGDEIVLLGDVTEDVTLPAGITFNGNGKTVNGTLMAGGNLTLVGHTKATNFNAGYNKPIITIGEGACLELTGTGRMVIGHGATFNITGSIEDAKTADVATLAPSLIIPGASFTGAGVTFNVTNAYISAPSSYCSSSKSASGTFDFNFTNSIWESAGKLAFESQSTAATVNFDLVNSVLNTGSHLVFGVSRGEVVIDNSNVNVGTTRQIENQSTMTIKNGSVVNGAVATSSNAKNPGTIIVENATYAVTGEFSGSDLGTGTLIVKKGATVSAGSITKANIQIDATGMAAGDEVNLTANLSNLEGSLTVVNNNLDASIVDGKIVLAVKPVAKIGETAYSTLEEAISAAQAGDVVKVFEGTYAVPAMKAGITIVGEGNVLFEGTLSGTLENLTLKNLHIKGGNAQRWAYAKGDLVFENVTFEATSVYALHFDGITEGTNLTYKNCTIIGWAAMSGSPASCVFDGCTIKDNGTYGVIRTYFDATIENCTFDVANANTSDVYQDGIHAVSGAEITVNGCTNVNGEMKDLVNVSGASVVTVDGVEIKNVAQVGETKYTDLQEALDAAAAGTGNVTVTILSDVDLTDVDWNPVTVSAPGYPVVTVDGNNKTITGLNDMLFAGTWAGKSGLIIKDLTIANSSIVNDKDDAAGTVGVGAFIGFPQASATITLENCHLKNSSVEGGHWTGGLIGYAAGYAGNDGPVFMNLTVKGCSVTGSTITGKGSVGGIIGHGSGNGWTNVVIEETTVKDNTITSTGSSNVKAGAVMGTIGAAGQPTTANGVTKTGGASVSATVAGNTVTSNGTTITTIYGRQGTETGMLYVAGGSYDNYPIEQGVAYAAPIEGYEIVQNTDGTYGIQKIPAYVAKIGEQGYASLAAALAAAQDDDVVTLLADVETADGIVITDKNLVIDLNGKTYTTTEGASTNNRNFKIEGTSVVTIKNGTMVAAGDYSSGAYGTVRTEGSANVTLEGLKLYNYRGNGLNIKACGSSVVTINDTEIYSNYGGGIESAGGTIEIANVKVEQKGMYTAPYNSMAISVNGGGKVTVNSGTFSTECITAEEANNQGTSHGPWVAGVLNSGGTLIINGGTFSNDNFGENSLATYARGAILADTKAKVEINGGKFNVLKNVIDIQNNLGDANNNPSVVLAGGTYNADPRISASYSSNLITLADGYVALPDLNGNYVVGVKPTATVNNLGMTTVAAGDYMVYGNGDNTADMPLSFVMQFLADQTEADMATSPYAEWYGDFVITFTGLENGSFTADGCYLAGHYGSFGWVKVPVDGMTIEEGARYPVMLGVGMGQKYDYICSSVQDFKCALYLTPEILEANPNIQVKLELAVVDNSKGSDDAASALINNENVYSVTEYTYDAEDFVVDPNYIAEFTIDDAARVDYVNDTDKTVGTLTYKRTLAEGAWNPLYLPFQVDVAQLADNYDIAYYNQMLSSDSNNDGAFDSYIMEVAYITSGTLKANYPYFIRPKTSDDCYLEYVANDVTLCAAKETVIVTSSVANTFKLHGTHKTVSAADLAGCYTIKASGWVQTTIDLRPHRLYLEILENDNSPFVPAAAKSIRIVVRGEDGYTGVEEITGENGEEMIFDLQGRRVLEPEKGGMYIINGKKVIY